MADSNNVPNRKVAVGGFAGAAMIIIAWASKEFAGIVIPAEVALSISTLIVFALQYFIPNKDDPGGTAQSPHFVGVLAIVLVILTLPLLTGCPGTLAVQRAETFEQKAAALLGDFNLYQSGSVQIGEDPTVSPSVRKAVLDEVIAAKPLADRGDSFLRAYRQVQRQLAAGETPDQQLAIAAANLKGWILDFTPLVSSLRTKVEEASP